LSFFIFILQNGKCTCDGVPHEDLHVKWLSILISFSLCILSHLLAVRGYRNSKINMVMSDWKIMLKSMSVHRRRKQHVQTHVAALQFAKRHSIKVCFDKQASENIRKWQEVLQILFDTVKTLASLGLPFHGHHEVLETNN
ncbi:hypothetical protein G0U57_000796, partial [Chelydra serpentina]